MKKNVWFSILAVVVLLSSMLAACAAPATEAPAPVATEAPAEPVATEAPAEPVATEAPAPTDVPAPVMTEEPEPIRVNVIYHPTIGGTTALAIADAYGMFEEEGLDIRYQRFTSGPPEIAAMVAGRADIGFIGSGAAWLAFRGDVNIIALDNLALTDEVIAKKSSGIATVEDLRGKTIATQLGTAGENILNLVLKKAGLTPADVTIINMDNNNLASAIISTGGQGVDAIAGWQPGTTAVLEALGEDGILLASNADFPQDAFPSTWVANKDFVKNNPEAVQKFVNALTRAQAYRAENMQEACEWASEKAGQAANDLYSQIPFAVWPTGPELKAFYYDGGFEAMLLNLRTNQVAGGKITEAEVKELSEVYISEFAKNATADY
jgi:NitT/TauT family transport system substrate-binding protein